LAPLAGDPNSQSLHSPHPTCIASNSTSRSLNHGTHAIGPRKRKLQLQQPQLYVSQNHAMRRRDQVRLLWSLSHALPMPTKTTTNSSKVVNRERRRRWNYSSNINIKPLDDGGFSSRSLRRCDRKPRSPPSRSSATAKLSSPHKDWNHNDRELGHCLAIPRQAVNERAEARNIDTSRTERCNINGQWGRYRIRECPQKVSLNNKNVNTGRIRNVWGVGVSDGGARARKR
jgi:hypothetical protein